MKRSVLSAATAAIVGSVIAFATPGLAQVNAAADTCTPTAGDGFCLAGTNSAPAGNVGSIRGRLQNYAREIFGEGARDTELTLPVGTSVTLTADFSGTGNQVDPGKKATITFTLNDGVLFAEQISALTFTEGVSNTPAGTKIIQSGSGGLEGDASVRYEIEVGDVPLTAANSVFTFTVPSLMNATTLGIPPADGEERIIGITVTVEPESNRFDTGAKFPVFPATGSSPDDNVRALARSSLLFPLTITPASEQTVNINIDDRDAFVPNDNVVTITGASFPEGRSALRIASLDIDKGGAAGADSRAFNASSGDMVRITASGSFGVNDTVFLSSDTILSTAGAEATRDTMFSIQGATATSSVPLTSVRTMAGTDTTYEVYYLPAAGREALSRGLYKVTFDLDFAEETMKDTMGESAGVRVEYSNLSVQGYAYAIPPPSAVDIGRLRLRCESAGMCSVFLDCQNEEGDTVGRFPELMIGPKMTMVLSTKSTVTGRSLVRALGLEPETETWRGGRLSCEILSNANIGVQVLTRSSGTLVNNTYVSGSEPSTAP